MREVYKAIGRVAAQDVPVVPFGQELGPSRRNLPFEPLRLTQKQVFAMRYTEVPNRKSRLETHSMLLRRRFIIRGPFRVLTLKHRI